MKKVVRLFSVCIIIMFGFYALQAQTYSGMAKEILSYINEHRERMGLQPLKMNDAISHVAEIHSKEMAKGIVPFGHTGYDERMERIAYQIGEANASAENVAEGASTAKAVVNMWLHSPPHRKNMEGHYNLTGIGIAESNDGSLYFTQIFIHKQ